jgi:hypothetical protein
MIVFKKNCLPSFDALNFSYFIWNMAWPSLFYGLPDQQPLWKEDIQLSGIF